MGNQEILSLPAMSEPSILIVEDHDMLREGLQVLLEAEGFRTIAAVHGSDGLEKLKSSAPDLILSDISMPEMDGF